MLGCGNCTIAQLLKCVSRKYTATLGEGQLRQIHLLPVRISSL